MIEQKIRESLREMADYFDGEILAKLLKIAQEMDRFKYIKNLTSATLRGIHTEPQDAKLIYLEVTFEIPLDA